MLGNFSFGDYFKKEAIAFAWEFLTRDLGLAQDRLKVTVFKGEGGVPRDAEAHGFWTAHVPADRILELGTKDNFWAMGDTGPCGPCSEIHYFQGDDLPCPEEAGGRRAASASSASATAGSRSGTSSSCSTTGTTTGALNPLPAPCVDTGMGLERVAAVVQGKLSNYDTDLFTPLLARRRPTRAGTALRRGRRRRRLAARRRRPPARHDLPDLATASSPATRAGATCCARSCAAPCATGRSWASRAPFLSDLTGAVVDRMKAAYPELVSHAETVARVVRGRGGALRDHPQAGLRDLRGDRRRGCPPGRHDPRRRGLPPLRHLRPAPRLHRGAGRATAASASTRAGFERELAAQQERARQASKHGRGQGRPGLHEARRGGRRRPTSSATTASRSRTPASSRSCSDGALAHAPRRRPGGPDRPRPHALLRRWPAARSATTA